MRCLGTSTQHTSFLPTPITHLNVSAHHNLVITAVFFYLLHFNPFEDGPDPAALRLEQRPHQKRYLPQHVYVCRSGQAASVKPARQRACMACLLGTTRRSETLCVLPQCECVPSTPSLVLRHRTQDMTAISTTRWSDLVELFSPCVLLFPVITQHI